MSKRQLQIDIKTQDRLREKFSKQGETSFKTLTGLSVGDSDINYEIAYKNSFPLITDAPFNSEDIRFKLISNGIAANLAGSTIVYARRLVDNTIRSLYQYPLNSSSSEKDDWFLGNGVPSVETGKEVSTLPFFVGDSNDLEGLILFAQTLPDNYFDEDGVQERVNESFSIDVFYGPNVGMADFEAAMSAAEGNSPTGYPWMTIIKDEENGSIILLSHGLNQSLNIYKNYNNPVNPPPPAISYTYLTIQFRGNLTGSTHQVIITLNNTLT